ncbi:hypothetical protein FACS1894139_01920 [Planctomycetales bacterium]|nr:hypothetical protein FACS1894107_10660 [Planctomycetales bacterium]GHS96799.1 hypothetical protein FACS1894108_02040 [Planctomycetales bacterium]GHT02874.1 hypothetical protein FACS1894139_01920 [Planctomycetales bacterium]GHV23811.1 hypothetical protein AGMMS49959_18190 [Planctomycetales bacterium]
MDYVMIVLTEPMTFLVLFMSAFAGCFFLWSRREDRILDEMKRAEDAAAQSGATVG